MQSAVVIFLVCVVVSSNGQYMMNPYNAWGMGGGWGGMWRSPGMMPMNSMGYPSWRSSQFMRMADKNLGMGVPQDVINVPKVPASQEILSHMVLANPNPKPYIDSISDVMYDPQKVRQAILTPVYLQGNLQGMNTLRANNQEDCAQDNSKLGIGLTDWLI